MSQTTMSSGAAGGAVGRKGPLSGVWALAAVLIVMLLVVGIPLGYMAVRWTQMVVSAPGKMGSAISEIAAEAVRPRLTMSEVVVNSIGDLKKENKLVVFTAVINTDVTREEGYSSGVMYWGTNVARIAVKDARVQFVVDLSKLETSDFQYNESAKVLTLFIPQPKIDTQMVSIDPAKIETLDLRGGWMRWNKQETRNNAIAELKPKVITQAQTPFVKELASAAGIETTTKFLQPLADALAKEGAVVKVVYKD